MIIPDINLLLYATITGFPHHEQTREWWERHVNGTDQIGLTSPVLFGFLRISTNARVLETPMAVRDAIGCVQQWLAQPTVSFLTPGPHHLDVALRLLESVGTAANLTTDVQLAAFAIEEGAELHSNDSDFGRFPDVQWVNPLQSIARL